MSNKYNFDVTVSSNTYAGEAADDFYAAAVEEAVSLNNGGVTLVEGITYKHVLPTVNVADPVVASSCTFSDGANTTIDEQVLELTDLAVMEEYCIKTIRPLWHTYVRQASRHNLENPGFEAFFLAQVAKATGQSIERGIWRGTSPYGLGFLSDDGTLDETGADASIFAGFVEHTFADALAAADILTDMAGVLNTAITNVPAVLDQPGAGFYMGREAYWFYAQALSAAGSNSGQNNGDGFASGNKQGLTYQGFPVYMCPGMFADTIALTYPGNVFVGTSAGTDFNEIKAIDLRETTGDDKVRGVGRFQIGVQVANVGDGVFGSTVWTQ